ncbi:hypothetical protein CC86DRAFT_366045 [Ophiobolus disseminans]|uniref:Uncharacterized protein n=1 Tax=Ophiobolus disseminans TaxID=1469910 RepID=A0A6A7AFW8_9PLEO|nr:hypothetical protein CC86DRAFT_366045 [Ophiobolus disseminans]
MASLVFAVGVAIFIAVEKTIEHKKEKRSLREQEALERGLVEELSPSDDTTSRLNDEDLGVYHKEHLPSYHMKDRHSAFYSDRRSW